MQHLRPPEQSKKNTVPQTPHQNGYFRSTITQLNKRKDKIKISRVMTLRDKSPKHEHHLNTIVL
jgi:hypothetical protein